MEQKGIAVVLTTTETREDAEKIAASAVERRLAACAQVEGPITSFYWWEGKMERSEEWLVRLKTTWERYTDLEQAIVEVHPYSVPQIVALPAERVLEEYKKWLCSEVTG